MNPRRAPLLGMLLAALVVPAAAAAQADDPTADQGYEYFLRVGKLNLDYSRYEAAADAFRSACRAPEGVENFECYRLWATAAEKAYRIDEALLAWDGAEAVAEQGNTLARDEAGRIRATYGEVVLHAPWGRTFPSLPFDLVFEGLLLDPELKEYLERVTSRLAGKGLEKKELFLPGGTYRIGDMTFISAAGERVELLLPERLVPYRSAGVGAPDGARAVAGPGGIGVAFEPGAFVAAAAAVGTTPVALGLQVRAGLRRGPVRIEGRLRAGVVPTSTNADPPPPGDERSGAAVYVLGQADVGLDLQPAASWLITPHVGGVGGSLGSMVVACQADAGGIRWSGECRLPAAAGGVQVGVDLTRFLGASRSAARAELRAGVRVDVLRAGIVASPGDVVGEMSLHESAVAGFAVVAPGGEIGVTVRF